MAITKCGMALTLAVILFTVYALRAVGRGLMPSTPPPAPTLRNAGPEDEMPSLRGNTIHRGRNAIKVSKAMPRYASELVPTLAAPWALPNEAEKEGTGMLFFAYGGEKQVNRFLGEA